MTGTDGIGGADGAVLLGAGVPGEDGFDAAKTEGAEDVGGGPKVVQPAWKSMMLSVW